MTQRLVAAQRVGMVIRVALQVKQGPVGEDVVAVPGVVGLAHLVSARCAFLAQQAIVFDVVGRGQLKIRPERRHHQKRQHLRSQPSAKRAPQQQGDEGGLQDLVVQGPHGLAVALQPGGLQRPGPLQCAWHFPQHKAVDGFAHARRCRVQRCGHIAVVAPVVFNEEVAIA